MGPWENCQKPAKGENSSQSQLSQITAYSTQKEKKIFVPSMGMPLKSKGLSTFTACVN